MPMSCSAPGCTRRYGKCRDVNMYRFPLSDKPRLDAWLIKMARLPSKDDISNRSDGLWEPKKHDRICNLHFVKGCPSKDPEDVDYVPTLFAHTHPTKKTPKILEGKVARYKRLKQRRENQSKSVTALIKPSSSNKSVEESKDINSESECFQNCHSLIGVFHSYPLLSTSKKHNPSHRNPIPADQGTEDLIDGISHTSDSGCNDMNDNVRCYKPRPPVGHRDFEVGLSDTGDNVESQNDCCDEVVESYGAELILQDYNRNMNDVDDDVISGTETTNKETEIENDNCNTESQSRQNSKSTSNDSHASYKFDRQNKAKAYKFNRQNKADETINKSDASEDEDEENRLVIDEHAKVSDRLEPSLENKQDTTTPTTKYLRGKETYPSVIIKPIVERNQTNTASSLPSMIGNQTNSVPITQCLVLGNQTSPAIITKSGKQTISPPTKFLVLGNQANPATATQFVVLNPTAATKHSTVGIQAQSLLVGNQTKTPTTTQSLIAGIQTSSNPATQSLAVGNQTKSATTTQPLIIGKQSKTSPASFPSFVDIGNKPLATTQPLKAGNQTKSNATMPPLKVGNQTNTAATSSPSVVDNQTNAKAIMVPLVEQNQDKVKMVCLVVNNPNTSLESVLNKPVLVGQRSNMPVTFKPVYVDVRKQNSNHGKSITTDKVILGKEKGITRQVKPGRLVGNIGPEVQEGSRVIKAIEKHSNMGNDGSRKVTIYKVGKGNEVLVDRRPVNSGIVKHVTPKVIKRTVVSTQAKRTGLKTQTKKNAITPLLNGVKTEDRMPVCVNSKASNAQDEYMPFVEVKVEVSDHEYENSDREDHSPVCVNSNAQVDVPFVEVKVEASDHEFESSDSEINENVINEIEEMDEVTDNNTVQNNDKEAELVAKSAEKTVEIIDDLADKTVEMIDDLAEKTVEIIDDLAEKTVEMIDDLAEKTVEIIDDLDDVKDEDGPGDLKDEGQVKCKTKPSDYKSLHESSEVENPTEAPEIKVFVEAENEIEEMDIDFVVGNIVADDNDNIPYTELSDSGGMADMDLTCKRCWLCFDQILEYNLHIRKCKIEFSCPICCKVFYEQDALTTHMDQCVEDFEVTDDLDITALEQEVPEAEMGITMCMICSGMFVSREALQEHALVCKRGEVCRRCRESFPDKETLKKHPCPERRVFSCGMCGKVFEKCHVLKAHMKIHTNERDFVCTVCSKTFLHKHQLKNHMGKHNDERAFKCPDCDLSYKYKSNLDKHRKTHLRRNERKQYLCRYCEHPFFSNDHRRRHEENNCRRNELSRTFHCEKCSATFKNKYTLARHVAVHDKGSRAKKMISCEHCDQSFFVKKHLKQHLNIAHDIEESDDSDIEEKGMELDNTDSSADELDSEFDTDDDEKRHVSKLEVLMSNLKKKGEFGCKDCDRVFRSAGNLERHLKLMHDQ